MAIHFLDSSAIVKHYFREQGHDWVEVIHDPATGHELYISEATLVEVVASICRKAHEQDIPVEERDATIGDFRQDVENIYNVRLVDRALYTTAGNLCHLHRLRAYDAVQLSCAIAVREEALAVQSVEVKFSEFAFVSGDLRLLSIAVAEGFRVENPNNYS
jgi:predicted nucleic acid-binding protein